MLLRGVLLCVALLARPWDASAHRIEAFEESEEQTETSKKTVDVGVRVYWIRHGTSCANIIREFKLSGFLTQHTYADPSLTDCAIEHAKVLGKQIRSKISAENMHWPHRFLIFSSVLVRAMETALYNFPRSTVYPIPYIAEHDNWPDNMPLEWQALNSSTPDQSSDKLVRPPNTQEDLDRLKFVPLINDADDPDRNDKAVKDSYDMFLKEFPKMLSALLPVENLTAGTRIPVVVVSHSGFMRTNLRCSGKSKPTNNEVWVKDYTAELVNISAKSSSYQRMPRRSREALPMVEAGDDCVPPPIDPKDYPGYKGVKLTSGSWPCGADFLRCSSSNMFMPVNSIMYPSHLRNASCCPSPQVAAPALKAFRNHEG